MLNGSDYTFVDLKEMVTKWKMDWNKKYKNPRSAIDLEMAVKISKNPPPNTSKVWWSLYILIGWSFLLRHGEVRQISPSSVNRVVLPWRGKNTAFWIVVIDKPKTDKGMNGYNTVRIRETTMPSGFANDLYWFTQLQDQNLRVFETSIKKNTVCRAIRDALLPLTGNFVFHSLRHGRATNLYTIWHYVLEELKDVGRWKSEASARMYIHKMQRVSFKEASYECDEAVRFSDST